MPTTKIEKITAPTFHPVTAIITIINGYVRTIDLLSLFTLPDKGQVSGQKAGHLEQQTTWQTMCIHTRVTGFTMITPLCTLPLKLMKNAVIINITIIIVISLIIIIWGSAFSLALIYILLLSSSPWERLGFQEKYFFPYNPEFRQERALSVDYFFKLCISCTLITRILKNPIWETWRSALLL